jgi:hypothetical protein
MDIPLIVFAVAFCSALVLVFVFAVKHRNAENAIKRITGNKAIWEETARLDREARWAPEFLTTAEHVLSIRLVRRALRDSGRSDLNSLLVGTVDLTERDGDEQLAALVDRSSALMLRMNAFLDAVNPPPEG